MPHIAMGTKSLYHSSLSIKLYEHAKIRDLYLMLALTGTGVDINLLHSEFQEK